jgi:hypothetical protein
VDISHVLWKRRLITRLLRRLFYTLRDDGA